jgi:HD-like signal output (HDOD) protein
MFNLENIAEAIDIDMLPSGPRILAQMSSLFLQPEVELAEIAGLIHADSALTARVMATCNSSYYASRLPVVDIRDAVLRLGLKEISRLVQIVTLTDLRKFPTCLYAATSDHFWERSLHTAYVAEELGDGDPSAYTAGIMHLVGIWVLCSLFPAGLMTIEERELALRSQLERLRMGVSFTEAGAAALAKWGFAPKIREAVYWQCTPSASNDPEHRTLARALSRAVAVADWHYGARNEKTLIRSDLTITDLEECSHRAALQVARIGFGF